MTPPKHPSPPARRTPQRRIIEPSKELTPEERAFMNEMHARKIRRLFGDEIKAFLLIMFVALFVLTLYVANEPAEKLPNVPVFSDCARLMDPSVHQVIKLKIVASYFPYRPLCRLKTGPFTVNNVFQTGKTQSSLTLNFNRYGAYEPDAGQLLQALLPDRNSVQAEHASMAVMDAMSALTGLVNGDIDIPRLINVLGKSGAFSSYAGENAALIKAQLVALATTYALPKEKIMVPGFLDVLMPMQQFRGNSDPRMRPDDAPISFQPGAVLDYIKRLGNDQ